MMHCAGVGYGLLVLLFVSDGICVGLDVEYTYPSSICLRCWYIGASVGIDVE